MDSIIEDLRVFYENEKSSMGGSLPVSFKNYSVTNKVLSIDVKF